MLYFQQNEIYVYLNHGECVLILCWVCDLIWASIVWSDTSNPWKKSPETLLMSPAWHVVPSGTDLVPRGRLGGSRNEGDAPSFTEERKSCSERRQPAQGYPQRRGKAAQSQPAVAFQHPIPTGPPDSKEIQTPHHHLLLPNRLLPPQGFCAPLLILLPKQKGVLTFSCFWTFAYAILSAWNISSLLPFSR